MSNSLRYRRHTMSKQKSQKPRCPMSEERKAKLRESNRRAWAAKSQEEKKAISERHRQIFEGLPQEMRKRIMEAQQKAGDLLGEKRIKKTLKDLGLPVNAEGMRQRFDMVKAKFNGKLTQVWPMTGDGPTKLTTWPRPETCDLKEGREYGVQWALYFSPKNDPMVALVMDHATLKVSTLLLKAPNANDDGRELVYGYYTSRGKTAKVLDRRFPGLTTQIKGTALTMLRKLVWDAGGQVQGAMFVGTQASKKTGEVWRSYLVGVTGYMFHVVYNGERLGMKGFLGALRFLGAEAEPLLAAIQEAITKAPNRYFPGGLVEGEVGPDLPVE